MGMGIGDWGLGIGDWGWGLGIGPIPNPQSPIPILKYRRNNKNGEFKNKKKYFKYYN